MIARFWKSLFLHTARWMAGAEGRWLGGTPEPAQRIYCANHTSHLDALLLMASLPQQLSETTRPVAAADYWRSGPIRRYLTEHVFGAVLIERERNQLNPLGPAIAALRQGDSLLFFPEGQRGPGGFLQTLKPGIYWLARAFPQVPIIPVWIENSSRVLPKRARLPVPGRCTLYFGAPLHWGGEEAPAFLLRVKLAMEALLPTSNEPGDKP